MKDCTKVITIPQYTGTCWFNAILMALLYSEGMRTLLLKASKNTSPTKSKQTLRYILENLYTQNENIDHVKYFDKIRPETILKEF